MVRRIRLQASITVEAVFIVPIIVFIVTALLFFTMYLHDQTTITCIMNEACERFNQTAKQPTNYESGVIFYDKIVKKGLLDKYTGDYSVELKSMKTYIKTNLEKRMMLGRVSSIEVEKQTNGVSAVVTTKNSIPLLHVLVYIKGIETSTNKVEQGVYNPPEYARAADAALDVVGQTKVFERITKMFRKIESVIG